MMAKAPKQSGASGASAPPAIITSASSRAMARNASPIAMAPEAQLIPLVAFGPVQPNSIAMLQLAAPANTVSASAGSTARGPWVRKLWYCCSPCATPPSAVPIIAPTRSGSSRRRSSSASASAIRVAAMLNWEKRSSRRARRSSMWSVGWKSSTSPAIRDLKTDGIERVMARTAERAPAEPVPEPLDAEADRRDRADAGDDDAAARADPVVLPMLPFRRRFDVPLDPRQRPRRDAVDEDRADHQLRGRAGRSAASAGRSTRARW